MAQPISPMPYSQEGFVGSNLGNNTIGMVPANPGLTNRDDMGSGAIPGVEHQSRQALDYRTQDIAQNGDTAIRQHRAGATRAINKEELTKATANNLVATKVAQVVMDNLEQQGGHSYLLALNNELQGPNGNQHIANLQNSVNTFRRA